MIDHQKCLVVSFVFQVMITPPFTITDPQCDDYLQQLGQSIAAFEIELHDAGLA
jgi:hypothetical protein